MSRRQSLDCGDYETLASRVIGYSALFTFSFVWVMVFVHIGAMGQ
jgi:hypothetical protein